MEKRVYFESYGCPSNRCDLEIMLGCLRRSGYSFTRNLNSADVLLINTCGVKKQTEDRMIHRIRFLSSLNKTLVVAGCLPKINLSAIRKSTRKEHIILSPQSIHKVVDAIENSNSHEAETLLSSNFLVEKPRLPKVRLNPILEVIQIAEGCAGACTYCCTRIARGKIHSYPEEAIIKRVEKAIGSGIREIWLTAQDLGAYGVDRGNDIASLLDRICNVKGDFLIRLGMMNPQWLKKLGGRLVEIYKHRQIFKFLHVPVQSGDDTVLKDMKRSYNVKEFKSGIKSFRKEIPKISIATDVICGFPTESEKAFDKSLKLIDEIKPDFLNISRFYPRPGTPMWGRETLPEKILKFRSRKMTFLFQRIALKKNKGWVGWTGDVLIDEEGKAGSWIGRNFAYKPIVLKSSENLLGKSMNVVVKKAFKTHLEANVLS